MQRIRRRWMIFGGMLLTACLLVLLAVRVVSASYERSKRGMARREGAHEQASGDVSQARLATDKLEYGTGDVFTPTCFVYLPVVLREGYTCPAISENEYAYGIAYQYDQDDPVRLAYLHADKNLALRGYVPNEGGDFRRELVDYGSGDPTQPPQFATLFIPHRVPHLVEFYQVHHWNWAPSPDPGTRGDPITDYPVTALGLQTTPGEILYVPESGYNIGGDPTMEVLILFADHDSVALRYTREDSSAPAGYTVHVHNICTDPNLLALYNSLDDPLGPRYQYPNPWYDLPNLPEGKPIGTARDEEIVVAIVDTGGFMPPHSCHEWWQIRPGYAGTCPRP